LTIKGAIVRIPFLICLFAAGLVSTSARAQEPDVAALQMKACTLVKDDAARVRCYDRAMERPASEPSLMVIPQQQTAARADVVIPQQQMGAKPDVIPQQQMGAKPDVIPQQQTAARPDIALPASVAPAAESPSAPPEVGKPETRSFFDLGAIARSVTPSLPALVSESGETRNAAWQVKADNPALQQASRLTATLQSADRKATLVLQCKDNNTQAYVSTDSFLGWESLHVTYRLDGGLATEATWSASADGRAALASNAREFIEALNDGGLLSVRVSDYSGADHDQKFSLGAVSTLRSQLATVCRWPGVSAEQKTAERTPPKPARPSAAGLRAPMQVR
jgi:hypothetical protein